MRIFGRNPSPFVTDSSFGLSSLTKGGPSRIAVLRAATRGRGRGSNQSVGFDLESLEGRRLMTDVVLSGSGPFVVRTDESDTVAEFLQNGAVVQRVDLASLGSITVTGGAGDDRLTLDFSDGNIIPGGVTFDGGGGNNVLEILGREGVGTVNLNGGAVALDCDDFYATDGLSLNVNAGTLTLNASQQMAGLTVAAGASAVLSAGGGKVLVTRALTIAQPAGASLDLNDNDLILDYTGTSKYGDVFSLVQAGFNAGSWNGSGIRSSAAAGATGLAQGMALGTGEASALGITTFAGVPVDSTAIVVRYTYYGDADLDLDLDANDTSRLNNGYANHLTAWTDGNFIYGSSITADDFAIHDREALKVNNVPNGLSSATEGVGYTLTLPSSIGAIGTVSSWQIDWGDGTGVDSFAAAGSRDHTYQGLTQATELRGITVTAVGATKSFTFSPLRVTVNTGFTLTGSAVPSSEDISLSWSAVTGADQYRIELSSDGIHFVSSSVIDPGLTSYEFSGFDPGDSFVFRAIAMAGGADIKVSGPASVSVPEEPAGDSLVTPADVTGWSPAVAPGNRRWVVGFNGFYQDSPLESVGNEWFDRTLRDTGEALRSPVSGTGQVSYNYNQRQIALGDLYHAIDVNDDLHITADEAQNARVAVLGYSLGGVEAANFSGLLNKTGNRQVVRSDGIGYLYVVDVPVQVDLLVTMDPVTAAAAQLINHLRIPKDKITPNVQKFENFYERRGGSTQFNLYFPGTSNNGDSFNQIYFADQESLTSPLSPLIRGSKLKFSIPASNVTQLDLTNTSQVNANRHASNVQYWRSVLDGPVGSDNFDANLKASGVEHLSLPWYVRGGVNGVQGNYDYDSQMNVLLDIHNI